MSDALPEGWAEAPLATLVANIQTGFACGKHSRDGGGVAHLRPMNVSEEGQVVLDDVKYIAASEVDRDERWLRQGDVVFNNTNSPELVGKTGLYTFKERRAFSNHMTRLRCASGVLEPAYCALALRHRWQTGYFQAKCNNHVSQASVGRELLLSTNVQLPPLAEQHRIVAKVEELLEEVNRAKARLTKVQAILKRFRQSVLAAACSGELTREWRSRRASAATAQDELGTMFVERRSAYERRVADHRKHGKRKPPIPKNLAPAEVPADASALPETWAWVLLDDVCDDITVGYVGPMAKEYVVRGVPFLRSLNVRPFRFEQKDLKFVSREFHEKLAKSALHPGDLVVVRSGNAGVACVIPPELKEANCSDLVVMRPSRLLDPHYGAIFINSADARAHIDGVKVGIAQGHFNIGSARETPLPLPPSAEQAEIVARVHQMFSLADAIDQRVRRAATGAERLPQAILSKAFSGELVPTEADTARQEGRDYEPASVLLERVKADAADGPTTKKKRGTKRQRASV